MSTEMSTESAQWTVLVNAEQQYGLYPEHREAPSGWRPTGVTGTEDDCIAYVDRTWTDTRPATARPTT